MPSSQSVKCHTCIIVTPASYKRNIVNTHLQCCNAMCKVLMRGGQKSQAVYQAVTVNLKPAVSVVLPQ